MIGPASRHLDSYLDLIAGYFEQIAVISTSREMGKYPTEVIDHEAINPSVKSPGSFLGAVETISSTIRRFTPDIIHIQQAGTMALAACLSNRAHKAPIIITALGSDVLLVPRQGWLQRKMVEHVLNSSDHITCDAQVSARAVSALLTRERPVTVVNFGVGPLHDPDIKKEKIVYSNRLHEKLYRIDKVLEMFAEFTALDPQWKLIIAGQGSLTESLKLESARLGLAGKTEFVGWLSPDENIIHYNRARIYISIPQVDATSVSLLEAMACDCIPVVSDIPANREWVQNRINGILCSDNDEGSLYQAAGLDPVEILRYNRTLLKKMADRDRSRETFLSIYENYLSRP